ncbi:hypothetical protein ACFWNN_39330 [Lentzea sp. NPDC058450]|uniref:hypothetical protein n=1 Tax=Lentzea sp. NPDC058450 TaxID=3346505 RepID=UPI00365A762F
MHQQPGLLNALGPLGRDRVGHGIGPEAVAGLADVVALLGVGLEPVPALFEHLQHVPLGDALLDAPSQHLRRGLRPATDVTELERFVGRDQPHAELLKATLDLVGDVRPPADPPDLLADDDVEPAVRPSGFLKQVVDATVARDRDLEHLVRSTLAARGEVLPARLDVVEVRDDDRVVRQGAVTPVELPQDRERRVLLVVRGRSSGEGNTDEPVVSTDRGTRQRVLAIYSSRPRPLLDRCWATHAATSRRTRNCSRRSAETSRSSASRISNSNLIGEALLGNSRDGSAITMPARRSRN